MLAFSQLAIGAWFKYMGRILTKIETQTTKKGHIINAIELADKRNGGGAWMFDGSEVVELI